MRILFFIAFWPVSNYDLDKKETKDVSAKIVPFCKSSLVLDCLTPAALDPKHEGEFLETISGKRIGQNSLVFTAISSIMFQIWCKTESKARGPLWLYRTFVWIQREWDRPSRIWDVCAKRWMHVIVPMYLLQLKNMNNCKKKNSHLSVCNLQQRLCSPSFS